MSANLGEASTEELMRELIARDRTSVIQSTFDAYTRVRRVEVLAEMLGSMNSPTREYRTVDS